MAHFLEIQKRALKATPQKASRDLFVFIRSLEKKMADLNRDQLNKESKDVFGNDSGFYSRATDELTDGRKEFGTPFTLFDEGVFLPSVFSKVLGQLILFGAKDPKADDVLEGLLSKDIFGLSDEGLREIVKTDIVPFLQKYNNNSTSVSFF